MAIYRIFPDKDSTIFTEQNTGNAGKDEIIEVGGYAGSIDGTGQAARIVLKFKDDEIDSVINDKIGNSTNFNAFSSSLKLFLATASEIPVDYELCTYPIYIGGDGEWDNGTGKLGDVPVNSSGVSWVYKNASKVNPWSTSGFTNYTTGSFITGKEGGGNWYTASNGENMEFKQTHSISSTHDVEVNITSAIKQIYTGSLASKGFIVKLEDKYEFYTSSSIRLKYFGIDTNTIYPPYLEFGWADTQT